MTNLEKPLAEVKKLDEPIDEIDRLRGEIRSFKIKEELALCSRVNFDNLEKNFPMIKYQPFYQLAKAQLDEALGYGTVEEKLKQNSYPDDL